MKKYAGFISAALLAAVLVSLISGCAKKDSNTFRVGMECDYAPFNWTQVGSGDFTVPIDGGGGHAGGYDVEIAKIIADGLGKKLVIVKTEWDGLTSAVDSGKIDAIIAGMSPREDRKESLDFSDNYYESELVIVVKKDSPYASATSISDFAGAKITGQLNTFHYDVIDQIDGVSKQTAMLDFPTMIVALGAGTIDGYISERPGAVSAGISNPELMFISFEGDKGFEYSAENAAIAVGLVQGSGFLADINRVLAGISEDERHALMENAIRHQPAGQ